MPVTFKKMDVRPLIAKGAEPFATIRARVDSLKIDEGLIVIAPFLPSPLIEKLGSEGFRSSVQHQADGSWAVNFWRED
ncbi:MAG: DUF2249 domain-containing protein [Spartobacteria bacterium]